MKKLIEVGDRVVVQRGKDRWEPATVRRVLDCGSVLVVGCTIYYTPGKDVALLSKPGADDKINKAADEFHKRLVSGDFECLEALFVAAVRAGTKL